MTVNILLITHDNVGTALLAAATNTLSFCPLTAEVLPVNPQSDPNETVEIAKNIIERIDDGAGVLVLTDIYGATPCNIACAFKDNPKIRILSGLNLPMLIRVFNYSSLSLEDLTLKAISGGKEGILDCIAQLTK